MLPSIGVYMDRQVDPYKKEGEEGHTTLRLENADKNILALCASSDELKMFNSEPLLDLIKFKWDSYGQRFHLFGCLIHIIYIIILFVYTDMVYV
jgi:hypothetical protein